MGLIKSCGLRASPSLSRIQWPSCTRLVKEPMSCNRSSVTGLTFIESNAECAVPLRAAPCIAGSTIQSCESFKVRLAKRPIVACTPRWRLAQRPKKPCHGTLVLHSTSLNPIIWLVNPPPQNVVFDMICMYVCMCIYIYVTYLYIHIHIYIYIYITYKPYYYWNYLWGGGY